MTQKEEAKSLFSKLLVSLHKRACRCHWRHNSDDETLSLLLTTSREDYWCAMEGCGFYNAGNKRRKRRSGTDGIEYFFVEERLQGERAQTKGLSCNKQAHWYWSLFISLETRRSNYWKPRCDGRRPQRPTVFKTCRPFPHELQREDALQWKRGSLSPLLHRGFVLPAFGRLEYEHPEKGAREDAREYLKVSGKSEDIERLLPKTATTKPKICWKKSNCSSTKSIDWNGKSLEPTKRYQKLTNDNSHSVYSGLDQ